MDFNTQLLDPPRECSVVPFWFWNDDLTEAELLRQIDDFEQHGVHGFVIHPRVGLPRSIGWMSDAMLGFMDMAIREAERRKMQVILYDEGMYPSGSSSGQVVATNPDFACRCLAMQELADDAAPALPEGQNLVGRFTTNSGKSIAVIDRKANAYIRGLHYVGDGPKEDEPPMGDILNPEAVKLVIELIHEKYHKAFASHFGKTVTAIFTDEPNALGKSREKKAFPATTGILAHVSRLLGYDFTPHLPALWFDDEPDAKKHREDYRWAIRRRMEETWYAPLSAWCESHGIALCGHPDRGDEIGCQRFFQIPGQDVVWRFVEPNKPTAIEGPESTSGKCSASAMLHHGRRRNLNEFCGAYGSETTFEEFKWLADWLLVRGVNMLVPHAFYYSVRTHRKGERPPQVGGVGCAWWDRFKPFADHCRRLSWMNTDSQHVADIAILAHPDHCPWPAAKVCFEHQRDFNYLDLPLLEHAAKVEEGLLTIAGMRYGTVLVDGLEDLPARAREKLDPMIGSGHVIQFGGKSPIAGAIHAANEAELLSRLAAISRPDVVLDPPSRAIRIRHCVKGSHHLYMFFNERPDAVQASLTVQASGKAAWVDTSTGQSTPAGPTIRMALEGYAVSLLHVEVA